MQNSYFYWSNDYEFVSYDLLSFVSLSLSLFSANMELLKGRVTNEQCEVFNLRYSRRKNRMTTTKIARRKGENPSFLLPRLYTTLYVTTPKLVTQMAVYSNSMSGKLFSSFVILPPSPFLFISFDPTTQYSISISSYIKYIL